MYYFIDSSSFNIPTIDSSLIEHIQKLKERSSSKQEDKNSVKVEEGSLYISVESLPTIKRSRNVTEVQSALEAWFYPEYRGEYKKKNVFLYRIEAKKIKSLYYMAGLTHPNLQKIYGRTTVEGNDYVLLENFDCPLVEHKKSQSPKELLKMFEEIVRVVVYLHSKGIVHKNINPYTILVRFDGSVILSGLEECLDEYSEGYSPNLLYYSSTQQLLNEDLGPEEDVWALGGLLYFLVTGKHPFEEIEPKTPQGYLRHILFEGNVMPEGVEANEFKPFTKILDGAFQIQNDQRMSSIELLQLIANIKDRI